MSVWVRVTPSDLKQVYPLLASPRGCRRVMLRIPRSAGAVSRTSTVPVKRRAVMPEPRGCRYRDMKWLWLSGVVLLLDQCSKLIADSMLHFNRPVQLVPCLDLHKAYNTGAAFSFLSDASGWQRWFFVALAAGVSVWCWSSGCGACQPARIRAGAGPGADPWRGGWQPDRPDSVRPRRSISSTCTTAAGTGRRSTSPIRPSPLGAALLVLDAFLGHKKEA